MWDTGTSRLALNWCGWSRAKPLAASSTSGSNTEDREHWKPAAAAAAAAEQIQHHLSNIFNQLSTMFSDELVQIKKRKIRLFH